MNKPTVTQKSMELLPSQKRLADELERAVESKGKNGLIKLKGPPGMGKSTLVKYLQSQLGKEALLVLGDEYLESPNPMSFLDLAAEHRGKLLAVIVEATSLANRNPDTPDPEILAERGLKIFEMAMCTLDREDLRLLMERNGHPTPVDEHELTVLEQYSLGIPLLANQILAMGLPINVLRARESLLSYLIAIARTTDKNEIQAFLRKALNRDVDLSFLDSYLNSHCLSDLFDRIRNINNTTLKCPKVIEIYLDFFARSQEEPSGNPTVRIFIPNYPTTPGFRRKLEQVSLRKGCVWEKNPRDPSSMDGMMHTIMKDIEYCQQWEDASPVIFFLSDHAGFIHCIHYEGIAAQSFLEAAGIPYIVSLCVGGKGPSYQYDPSSNTLTEIDPSVEIPEPGPVKPLLEKRPVPSALAGIVPASFSGTLSQLYDRYPDIALDLDDIKSGSETIVIGCRVKSEPKVYALRVGGLLKNELQGFDDLKGIPGIPGLECAINGENGEPAALLVTYVRGETFSDFIGHAEYIDIFRVLGKIKEIIKAMHKRGFVMPEDAFKAGNILIDEQGQPHLVGLGTYKKVIGDRSRSNHENDDLRLYHLIPNEVPGGAKGKVVKILCLLRALF